MKILFFCTHCNQGTGYARSANKITNWLANQANVEVVYYAFQNYPGQAITDRFIDPRIRFVDALELDPDAPKGFGDAGILPTYEEEKPDYVFVYNDLPVSSSIIELLPSDAKYIMYLDIVYLWQDIERFNKIKDKFEICYVFTQSWKDHLVKDIGWDETKIDVLRLGVDFEKFIDIDPVEAKLKMGFQEDDYIVLNLNRNSYRKQWCTTIKAWFKFWMDNHMDSRIKLFVGCMVMTDDGYDIVGLIKIECMKRGIDFQNVVMNHIYINPTPLTATDEFINLVHCACDVGINTCCGEGFGLTNVEHGWHMKPQVVAGIPSVKEVLGDVAVVIEPHMWTTMSRFESHGGEIALFREEEYANALTIMYRQGCTNGEKYREHIKKTCSWEENLKPLGKIIELL